MFTFQFVTFICSTSLLRAPNDFQLAAGYSSVRGSLANPVSAGGITQERRRFDEAPPLQVTVLIPCEVPSDNHSASR